MNVAVVVVDAGDRKGAADGRVRVDAVDRRGRTRGIVVEEDVVADASEIERDGATDSH